MRNLEKVMVHIGIEMFRYWNILKFDLKNCRIFKISNFEIYKIINNMKFQNFKFSQSIEV